MDRDGIVHACNGVTSQTTCPSNWHDLMMMQLRTAEIMICEAEIFSPISLRLRYYELADESNDLDIYGSALGLY